MQVLLYAVLPALAMAVALATAIAFGSDVTGPPWAGEGLAVMCGF